MLIKVDIEKAYDCLSWEFVHETLHGVGLPSDLIHLIMDYISLATIQILWIRECTDCFSPLRGLRQGDPISPYIFVICIERLSHRINKEVQSKHWKPIRLSQRGIPITHLFFFLMIFFSLLRLRVIKQMRLRRCLILFAKVRVRRLAAKRLKCSFLRMCNSWK